VRRPVRHGRAADRLRAAVAGSGTIGHGQAGFGLDRGRPDGAARRQPGPHGAVPAGQGDASGPVGGHRRVAHGRHHRARTSARGTVAAGRARATDRGRRGRPASCLGDLIRTQLHGRGTGEYWAAVRRSGVRRGRDRHQARPRTVPARGQADRRVPRGLLRPGGFAQRRRVRGGGGLPGVRRAVAALHPARPGPDRGAVPARPDGGRQGYFSAGPGGRPPGTPRAPGGPIPPDPPWGVSPSDSARITA